VALNPAQAKQIEDDLKTLTPEQQRQYMDQVEKQFGSAEPAVPKRLGPEDPGFYGDPHDPENIIEAGKFRGTAAAAGPTLGILGTAVAPALAAEGAGAVPGVIGAAARTALQSPAGAGAVVGGIGPLLRGDLTGAVKGAGLGALIGVAPGVRQVLTKVGRWGAPAKDLAEMTAGEMRTILSNMAKAGEGWVTDPSVEEVAAKMIPRGVPQTVGSMVGAAPEAAAAPQTVSSLMAEAPKPGPFVKTFDPLTAESVLAKVEQLKKMGLSRGQIISSLKETHNLKASQAEKVLTLIEGMQ